jgi:hypothetical protein
MENQISNQLRSSTVVLVNEVKSWQNDNLQILRGLAEVASDEKNLEDLQSITMALGKVSPSFTHIYIKICGNIMKEVIEKKCFKCEHILPIKKFYTHKKMPDGHLNKCIECTKIDVKKREKVVL